MKRERLVLGAAFVAVSACAPPSRSPAAVGGADAAQPWFTDVSDAWGLDFRHLAGASDERHLPESMGAGAAVCDVDEDGDLDLYLLQGGAFPPLAHGAATNELWLDERVAGERSPPRFVDATATSGAAAHAGYAMGVAWGDIDGDSHVDFYVTNFGPDVLLRGEGNGHFRDVTAASGISGADWTVGCALFDADADGDLDLYVCGYLAYDPTTAPWCGRREAGWRSVCHPDHFAGIADRFWRNRGDGTFVDHAAAAGLRALPANDPGKGLGVLPADLDLDGDLDLYVANDSTPNRLWWNAGDGTFVEGTLLSGTGVSADGETEAGMGLAIGDVEGDGDPDLFVTNFDDESNTLYVNRGGGLFADETIERGLEAPSRLPVGFGCALADFDADGDPDIAVVNGHIVHNIALYHDGKTFAQRAQLFANEHGRFREHALLAGDFGVVPRVGRGLLAADFDRDGRLDLLTTECDGRARLLRNVAPSGPSWTIAGLPRHARLVSDERPLWRVVGGEVSYASCGPDELVLVGADPGSLAIVDANGERTPLPPLPPGGGHLRARFAEGGVLAFDAVHATH